VQPDETLTARPHAGDPHQLVTLGLPDIGPVHVEDGQALPADALQRGGQIERGVQLVAQADQRRRELLALGGPLVQAGVGDGNRRQVGHALDEGQRIGVKAEGSGGLAAQVQDADHLSAGRHRRQHGRALAGFCPAAEIRLGGQIRAGGQEPHLPLVGLADALQSRPGRRQGAAGPHLDMIHRDKGSFQQIKLIACGVVQSHGHLSEEQEVLQPFGHRLDDPLDVQRAGHGLHHLVEQGFLLGGAAGFLVEPGQLDSAGGLAGEQLDRLQGVSGRRPAIQRVFHPDQADQAAFRPVDRQDDTVGGMPASGGHGFRRVGSLAAAQVGDHPRRVIAQVEAGANARLVEQRVVQPGADLATGLQIGL